MNSFCVREKNKPFWIAMEDNAKEYVWKSVFECMVWNVLETNEWKEKQNVIQ